MFDCNVNYEKIIENIIVLIYTGGIIKKKVIEKLRKGDNNFFFFNVFQMSSFIQTVLPVDWFTNIFKPQFQ